MAARRPVWRSADARYARQSADDASDGSADAPEDWGVARPTFALMLNGY